MNVSKIFHADFYTVSMNIKLWQNILESNEIHLLEKYF